MLRKHASPVLCPVYILVQPSRSVRACIRYPSISDLSHPALHSPACLLCIIIMCIYDPKPQ